MSVICCCFSLAIELTNHVFGKRPVLINAELYVRTFYLIGCRAAADISALWHVHILYLSGCSGVTDVSFLGHVHTLCLNGCARTRNDTSVTPL